MSHSALQVVDQGQEGFFSSVECEWERLCFPEGSGSVRKRISSLWMVLEPAGFKTPANSLVG